MAIRKVTGLRTNERARLRRTIQRVGLSGRGRNCLIVLQPRAIEPCLRSIAALEIDKVYFTAFTEVQLVEPLNQFIRESRYESYVLVADDLIVNAKALRLVEELLQTHEFATGYCHLCRGSPYVNLTRSPLRLSNGEFARLEDYDHYRFDEVQAFSHPVFETWFGGWTLTGVRRHLWLEHPFRVNAYTHVQSDFEFFSRLNRPGVAHRDAFVEHLKQHVHVSLDQDRIVGKIRPEIRFRRRGAPL